jgi:hypothetical protein
MKHPNPIFAFSFGKREYFPKKIEKEGPKE